MIIGFGLEFPYAYLPAPGAVVGFTRYLPKSLVFDLVDSFIGLFSSTSAPY